MSYPYTAENRLDAPHAYMYAPYGGEDFLRDYTDDRLSRLCGHLPAGHVPATGPIAARLGDAARVIAGDSTTALGAILPGERTELRPLLGALLKALSSGEIGQVEPWLARLIQRFEVSKKLYAAYAPGFRKGEGDARDPVRYAELALCLALAFSQSGQLQYLSTLLKLIDLLLSLDAGVLRASCAPALLEVLVEAELDAVRRLAAVHGVKINGE